VSLGRVGLPSGEGMVNPVQRMGVAIERGEFSEVDHERFGRRLRDSLVAFKELLERPGFGEGPITLGAELETVLVNAEGQAVPINSEVLEQTHDKRVTLELNQYNLEVNAKPTLLQGGSFSFLRKELNELLGILRGSAKGHDTQIAMIGILPTLTRSELNGRLLTDQPRYQALSKGILALREAKLRLAIDGPDPIDSEWDQMSVQGANTSFQVHLRTPPHEFGRTYNAAQLAVAPALAVSTNSPLFLGHRLWEETRIAVFPQSSDDRRPLAAHWQPSRCGFGYGWVRDGILELFVQAVALHAPLLPVLGEEDPVLAVRAGRIPCFSELKLHQSTVWYWNRAIYDEAAGGHLRVEIRPFPAGPTVQDMVATAAFMLGLTLALRNELEWMLPAFPFADAEHSFFQAARKGLDAELLWPEPVAPSPRLMPAWKLVTKLLPVAEKGLKDAGVSSEDISWALGIIEGRVTRGLTGARWQLVKMAQHEPRLDRAKAIEQMFREYRILSAAGEPVHTWPL
jgi:gamma-glutamyl:cysteine ligase YbdK (ATP-grasp superfamily)